MIVQAVKQVAIAKDNLTRYTVTLLIRFQSSRGRNLSRRNRNKRKRTEVISDNLSNPYYCIVNGDCLNRNAARLSGYRPVKFRQGNGAFIVVRAGESPVQAESCKTVRNGEEGQLIILMQLTKMCVTWKEGLILFLRCYEKYPATR
jgi:hypothetical protein